MTVTWIVTYCCSCYHCNISSLDCWTLNPTAPIIRNQQLLCHMWNQTTHSNKTWRSFSRSKCVYVFGMCCLVWWTLKLYKIQIVFIVHCSNFWGWHQTVLILKACAWTMVLTNELLDYGWCMGLFMSTEVWATRMSPLLLILTNFRFRPIFHVPNVQAQVDHDFKLIVNWMFHDLSLHIQKSL